MLPDGGIDNGKGHGSAADAVGVATEIGVGVVAMAAAGRLFQDTAPWIKQTAKAGGKEWIAQHDQNKDGKVSTDEYTSSELRRESKLREQVAGEGARVLMLSDQNNDNKLTMNELSKKVGSGTANAMMRDGDKNKDGFIDFGEANKLFAKKFDENEKIKLNWKFQEFDRNHNGVATVDEATAAIEWRLRSPGSGGSPSGGQPLPPGGQGGQNPSQGRNGQDRFS